MPLASAARRPPEPEGIDFTVSSSLPPMVAGGVAGEMELSVPHLYPKPGVLCPTRHLRDRQREPLFLVRVQWWGDRGPGTVFKPRILRGRDEDGEVARRTRLSKATCALFPVRCRLDGLLTYLKDMGSIALDVLVYEGDPVGARHVGRCVVPVGGWGGQLDVHPGSRESGVVADGYFPVLSLDGNRYAGDLGVCLRACLGGSSKLRNVVAVAKLAADRTGLGEERREIMEALGYGTLLLSDVERGDSGIMGAGRGDEGLLESGRRKGSGVRPAGEMYNGLPTRASFDSADLADGSSGGSPATVAVASSTARLPRGSAPMSSFQLNEALAKFDASDTLPMWPTPKGSLYHPPETYGEAPPRTHTSQRQVRGRPAAGIKADPGRKSSPISRKAPSGVSRGPPTRVGAVLTGNTRISGIIAGEPPERSSGGRADPKEFGSSVSPERQAPDPSRPDANRAISFSGGDDRGRADAEAPTSPRRATASPRQPRGRGGAATSASEPSRDGRYLSELLNRGKDLRDKMILAAGPNDAAAAAAAPPPSTTNASLPIDAAVDLAGLIARPGFVSGAQLGSSLRDDIEGIFDTLSDGDPPLDDEAGVLVRDPETRGSESRVVDLLLAAAGPPPSSLAFPALAAVERRRADSLARVRFLRIRLSRLVMFGSMASAPEGHGWQLRFRLPAFATPPGRSGAAARSRSRGASAAGAGSARNARVVSVPVPPRVPAVTLGKSKAAVRRGRSASGTAARTAASVLRVRRGFGACDLVVGETSLLEEMVCAVDVDDACVSQWMDTALEFLLVDGKTDGAPRPRPAGHLANHPHLKQQQQQPKASSTVGPGDRVAAVATLRMRDLILSADLGVATTLDLVEVSDFWAAEDARAASSGRVGRRGRPLRNPYRSEVSGGGARPLVLGDRAVGALAVALELVPGEQDVSPEHSRPEVERWSQGPRQRGAAAGQVETQARVSGWGEPTAEDGGDGASRTDVDLAPPPPRPPAEAAGARILPGGRGGDPPDNGDAEASEVRSSVASNLEDPAENATSKEGEERGSGTKPVTSPSPAARSPPSLGGSWKEGSGAAATPALDVDCAVVLRIDELSLVPAAGSGVEQVRVAYSFTQVEGSTPTVTHRSVRGHRAPPSARGSVGGGQQEHSSPFSFRHQEVFPAPADGGTWRLEAGTSRVFEVWGCASEGSEGGGGDGGGAGHPEALLGLAKVSLRPFAAFECAAGRGGGQRGGAAAEGSRLAVGADGPVAVVDPFSGRTVGELRLFLALGSSETIAALSDPRAGNCDAGAAAAEEEVGATGSAVDGVGEAGEEGGKGGAEQEGEWRIERQTKREENVHGDDGDNDNGVMDAVLAEEEPPALDDSVAELSMLLNPSWAKSPKPEAARSNSGFAGLVRHVIELSAVGELPLALDDASAGKEDVDGPVGCAIEYMLPSVQASPSLHLEADDGGTPPGAGQIHELWWDADSGILNSRSRHTIKVPGGMLDNLPAGPTHGGDSGGESEAAEDRPLHNLLDCMLGREDVVLSLYWSTGGAAGARQPAPWSRGDGAHEHEEANAALAPAVAREQRRSPLGTVVLRRADLLPLVRRTSARAVLRLPIEPAVAADEGGRAPALPPLPGTLPLSISYRREPSAVARRKSRGWSLGKAAGGGESDGGGGGQEESLDASCDADSTLSHADALEHPPNAGLGEGGEKSMGGEGPANGEHGTGRGESPSAIMPSKGSGVEGGSGGVDSPAFRGSCGQALVHPSSKTQHLLPARTKLCVFVASVSLGEDFVDVGERVADGEEKDLLLWVSFEFPGAKRSGQPERRRGGVFVWKPGDENAKRREVHWSPAASASRESGCDFVAPLQWTIELPVTIDAAFVEFVRTQSLELRVWKGGRASWPSSGTACGVGKLLLRPLLTTLEGVGGDVVVAAEVDGGGGGDRAGSVAARVSFKHRGLGSNGDASAETSEGQAGACSNGGDGGPAPGAAPAPGPGETSGRARRRVPVTFREEVEVFDQEEAGHRVDCDPAKRRGCAEMPPTGSGQPALGESSESPEPEGAGGEELSQESNSQQRQPGGTAPSPSSGGERGLEVCVEKAMRLVVASAAATALPPEDPEVAGCVVSPGTVLPSTYVTFRWEEEGKPPLRSPLVLRPLSSTSSRPAGEGGREGDWQDTSEEEVVTPVVEMSSNPVFNHVSKLRLVDPNSWGRVCGPSAALVFRVWRRPRRSWWDTPPQAASVAPAAEEEEEQQQPKPSPDGVVAAAAGSRFGDKLIGSAVVGLEILRGAIAARDVLCLREIDGWYHVLDDLQRPQGQLKVRVRPHPPSRVSGQGATSSLGAAPGQGQDQPLLPASLGSSSAPESIEICDDRKTDDGAKDIPPTPPLHDTQAHLRSVHALLDSLPAEFRSTQPRPPLRPPPPPAEIPPAARMDPLLELPAPSEEPGPSTTLSGMAALPPSLPLPHQRLPGSSALGFGRHGCEPPSMPELRRMLSSLDRVDRRLFALGDGRDVEEDESRGGGDEETVGDDCMGADNAGRGRAGRELGGDEPVANCDPTKDYPSLEAARPAAVAEGAEAGQDAAISRLQQAWRARSTRKRRSAEAETEREAHALRQERRERAATVIQSAHRRAQARYRARAAAEERRRRELRQQRRAAACAVLERAWRAFEGRRRAARELAEARGRAVAAIAAAAAARRAEETARGAVLVQAVWRGMSARAAVARRFEVSRARSLAAAPAADVPPAEQEASTRQAPSSSAQRLATGIAPAPQPQPSTFYNQLSQDPRRHRPLPAAHMAAAPSPERFPPAPARSFAASHSAAFGRDGKHGGELRAGVQQSALLGPRPLARSFGATKPPRFADKETARIARIMNGNLQHWATSARSSSSSDDVDT